MICNIIDSRSRRYRWREINAVIEATSHDNGCEDSDQQPPADDDLVYAQREGISLSEAIAWAHEQPGAVTLFLYDAGAGAS